MISLNTYLNFDGNTEEAFEFYRSVFGGEFDGIMRMTEAPDIGELPEEERNRILHISLPIGNQYLMGSDILPSMGHVLNTGNNNYISLHLDKRDEAESVFNALSGGGSVEMEFQKAFWGSWFGSFRDRYGVCWMISSEDQDGTES